MSHPEQINFCLSVKDARPQDFAEHRLVLDIGSLDVNGNNRELFDNCLYIGVDVARGKNVDLVCKAHELPFPNGFFDTIISTECLEHDQYWPLTLAAMVRLLKPGGLLVLSCATTGRPEHGTRHAMPQDSPGLPWLDYYQNLTEQDLSMVLLPNLIFAQYHFSIDDNHHDLYFCGVKRDEQGTS